MVRKGKIPFVDIARRFTGVSILGFGTNWDPPESKRDVVRHLMAWMEDRRVLYADYSMEYPPWVEESVLEMRTELTRILQNCPDDEHLTGPIRAIRAACRRYLDTIGPPERPRLYHRFEALRWEALGALRGVVGMYLAQLCVAYGVDVEPELASIFPVGDDDSGDEA